MNPVCCDAVIKYLLTQLSSLLPLSVLAAIAHIGDMHLRFALSLQRLEPLSEIQLDLKQLLVKPCVPVVV